MTKPYEIAPSFSIVGGMPKTLCLNLLDQLELFEIHDNDDDCDDGQEETKVPYVACREWSKDIWAIFFNVPPL